MTTTEFQGRTTQEIQQIGMYGCTEAELRESVESSTSFKFCGAAMVAASYLSDAQEMLEYSGSDRTRNQVRQMLNCAKWIMFEYSDKSQDQ